MSTLSPSVHGPDLLAVLDGAGRIVARAQFVATYTAERVRDRLGDKKNPRALHAFRSRNDLDEIIAWVGWVLGPRTYDWGVRSDADRFVLPSVTHFLLVGLLRDAAAGDGEEPEILWGSWTDWRKPRKKGNAFEFARDVLSRINETRTDGEVADRYSQATVSILGRRLLAEFLSEGPVGTLTDDVLKTLGASASLTHRVAD